METLRVPAVAVTVGAPPQPFTTFGVAAITTPAGSVSLKVRFVRAAAPPGLVTGNVSVLACPTPTAAGANALVSAGWLCTESPELVTALVTRAVAPMFPAAFVYGPPTTLMVTPTVVTQKPRA